MRPSSETLRKGVRFGITGVFVTALHTVIAVAFIRYAMPNPPLANGVAFVCATLTSYVINAIWSFSGNLQGRTLSRFVVVSAIGLLLAMSVAWIAQQAGYSYLHGIAAVALTVPAVTFVMHNTWTFR